MASAGQALAPLPPQNLDAEESVLGAMMLSESAIEAANNALDAGDFYRESHARIYRAAVELYQHGHPVDAITVADKLDERGELEEAGGKERIHELAALVPATSNAGHYARIVREMATLRGLTAVGEQIQRLGWERPGETPELVDRAEQMVFELAQHRIRGNLEHVEMLVRESFEQITKMYESGGQMTGTPTGFRDIDHLTSGLQPGNLVVIAGRPSMGKSAFALGIASNLALQHDVPVAVFTLEMSKIEVAQRLMCSEGRVELQRLRTGRLANEDWTRLVKACDALTKAPIYVDDTRLTTMLEIRSKARRLKAREPKLGAVVVDYLQLMSSGSNVENRVQEVSQISRALKVVAGDLEVPVIALSQLSRAVESRTDKRPLLSDLRESGCLTGDSRVYLPDRGSYRPIRELAGTSGFRVLAVDTDTWRLEPRTVTRAFATGTKPVYRLTTRRGHEIRATANHKFLAVDGWRRLDDLAPAMRIAAPRTLPGPAARTMGDRELALLGELVDRCGREPGRSPVRADEPRTPHERVPECVFEQRADGVAVFLRRLLGSGGDTRPGDSRRPPIRYGCSSAELAADVSSLLLRLGIRSARRTAGTGQRGAFEHEVVVSAGDEEMLLLAAAGRRAGPGAPRQPVPAANGWGRSSPYAPAAAGQASSHRALTSLAAAPSAVAAAAPAVPAPASGDVCWEEIAAIEPAGVQAVYDLTVDGLHSFVTADLLVHNSIEQDADLVMFLYRDEYYNEDSEDQGLAEVILAKHRNGPIGTEKLAFLKRFAKFADLAPQNGARVAA